MTDAQKFEGFEVPKQNYCRIPLSLFDNLDLFSSMAEMKVVLYILRHTWGFGEFTTPKPMTVDEFMFGRKRKDGSRMDKGTGLSRPSVRNGLKAAEENGFIAVTVDDSDKARVEKSYMLVMKNQGEKILPPDVKDFTPEGQTFYPRTEIDTLERNFGNGDVREEPKPEPVTEQDLLDGFNDALKAKANGAIVLTSMTEENRQVAKTLILQGHTRESIRRYTEHRLFGRRSKYEFKYIPEDLLKYPMPEVYVPESKDVQPPPGWGQPKPKRTPEEIESYYKAQEEVTPNLARQRKRREMLAKRQDGAA